MTSPVKELAKKPGCVSWRALSAGFGPQHEYTECPYDTMCM